MHDDFSLWLKWFRRVYPNSKATDEQCRLAYDAHYSCSCVSCTYRKEQGHIPVFNSTAGCKLDPSLGDLNYVPDDYKPLEPKDFKPLEKV